jgi:hypothetical protein
MILPYRIEVEFGEVYVFPKDLIAPCHDWTEDYVAQGFCWLETQVAFLTLLKEGVCEITVEIASEVQLRSDAIRAIQVPFGLDESSDVAICATPYLPYFTIPKGEYRLIYQTGLKHKGDWWTEMWCVFTFIRDDNAEAKILRRDGKLNPRKRLFTTHESSKPLIYLPPSTWE